MKTIYKNLTVGAAAVLLGAGLTSCLEETFPTSEAISSQVSTDLQGLNNGMSAYMTVFDTGSDYQYWDVGFASNILQRDAMLADAPVYDVSYDYFNFFASQRSLGNHTLQRLVWRRYYYLIQKANLVLNLGDKDPQSSDAPYMGDAYAYRAMAYYEMMHTYEYRPTGVERLDNFAAQNEIYGLTVPIITEETTEAQSRNTPRAPYYEMYRFIMNDLNRAEECLADTHIAPGGKNHACLGFVYGMKARTWLWMGTRYTLNPEDMTAQLQAEQSEEYKQYDRLGITDAKYCFEQAAKYARLAMQEGFRPLSKSQWFDPKSGFNTPNDSWLMAIIITTSDALCNWSWRSFLSYCCPEASWGVATPDYGAYRCIDAKLFQKIQDCDWRRPTWVAPEDAGNATAYTEKYAAGTSLTYAEWAKMAPYAGIKYHPNGGDGTTSTNGIAISLPLMRIEEMYFIEAEALANTQGPAAGKAALESFMNTYRTEGGTYTCPATDYDGVIEEIFNQKRIELWLEGVVYFDYKRLLHAIERGYPDCNYPETYRVNSFPGKTAPWTIYYIPDSESHENTALKLNPDPSRAIPLWK